MNFIQTLYINSGKDHFRDSFGWAAPEYHLMGWALSCLQLHKIYGNIALFANSPATHLLIDTLQLPYSKVYLTHDQLTLIHPDLWALPKIYTYSQQQQPFLHIDGDVFLFNSFDSNILKGELIAQNIEVDNNYYTFTQKELIRQFSFFPSCVKKDFVSGMPIQACNAGILGGNNVSFFHDYATLAFEYIHKNAGRLKYINVNGFNVFFEQHLFYAFAKERGLSIKVLFEDIIKANEYVHLGDFHDVPFNRNYLHLLGNFKRDKFICSQMAAKLRELYPEYYERIITLFHNKNLRLSPFGFINKGNSKSFKKRVNEQNNSHLQLLKSLVANCPEEIEKAFFQSDFENFYQQLISILKENDNTTDLYERDLAAQHWYHTLFSDSSVSFNQRIIRSREATCIESSFNWAGLFNKYYQEQVRFYLDLQIKQGHFFNLIVPEASDNGFSLYDINELDQAMLLLLSEPLSIDEVFVKMQVCLEDEVWQNHYKAYENLILESIKHLVLKKAIQSFSNPI